MAENPDHPAHRDQLACDFWSLQLQTKGVEIKSQDLMDARLRDPHKNK